MLDDSLQSKAYQAIRTKIIHCELEPGRRLSAVGLEKEMGIGRTPVRESFVRLREQGLVETRPKSGTYVSRIDLSSAEDARFLRETVERSVLVRCCSAATGEDLAQLEELLASTRTIPSSSAAATARTFFDLDNKFHESLYRIAGRSRVWQWLNTVNTHLERFRWLRVTSEDLDLGPIIDQHERMLHAVSQGNTDDASLLADMHLHLMLDEKDSVIRRFPDYFEPLP